MLRSTLCCAVTALLFLTLPQTAEAQNCNRNCDPSQRDAHGCCIKKKNKTKKPRRCPKGQKITADTGGHCCWTGQAWNGSRCVGTPQKCPRGWNVDEVQQSCRKAPKREACQAGKALAQDKKHCCWPGQAWSKMQNKCLGKPECPKGTQASGETCVGRAEVAEVSRPAVDTAAMVSVPGGSYKRGSTPASMRAGLKVCNETYTAECNIEWFEREGPQVPITVSTFQIDKFEVTNAQYDTCVKAGKCRAINYGQCSLFDAESGSWEVGNTPHADIRKPGHPVVCSTWNEADAYCSWAGKRLPTESEWEKAARGATDEREFPWGNRFDPSAFNWGENTGFGSQDGHVTTAPVGFYSASTSPYGAHDMAGNAMEWTSDWFDESFYTAGPKSDPRSTNSASGQRVARGGSWTFAANAGRVSYRFYLDPNSREDGLGFRCAASAGGSARRDDPDPVVPDRKPAGAGLDFASAERMIKASGYKILTTKDEKQTGITARVWLVSKGNVNAALTLWTFDNPSVFVPQTLKHLQAQKGFAAERVGDAVFSAYVPEDGAGAVRIVRQVLGTR